MAWDVIVIGGGAVGTSSALELARRGASVLLVEAGSELGAGCSAGSAGLLCPSHALPLATRASLQQGLRLALDPGGAFALRPRAAVLPWLARFVAACRPEREQAATATIRALAVASLALHVALAPETGIEQRGTLNLYEDEQTFTHGRREAAEHFAAGLRAEVLDDAEARALEPAISAPVAGAVYYPEEWSGDPLAFVRAVGQLAQAAGAQIRTGVEVLALRSHGGTVTDVETTAGTFRAGTVVLAAGAWSPHVARGLGLRLPVEGGKGYHVDYPADQVSDPKIPLFLQRARVVATPLPGRLRLAGTLELAGLDVSVSRRRVRRIEQTGLRYLRGLAGRPVIEVWRGLRPCAPDGLPIIGRSQRFANLVLATGHAMMGLTLAPLTGRLVAEIVTGEEPSQPIAPLAPDRFDLLPKVRGRTGKTKTPDLRGL